MASDSGTSILQVDEVSAFSQNIVNLKISVKLNG